MSRFFSLYEEMYHPSVVGNAAKFIELMKIIKS
jgi:hypothetical protein